MTGPICCDDGEGPSQFVFTVIFIVSLMMGISFIKKGLRNKYPQTPGSPGYDEKYVLRTVRQPADKNATGCARHLASIGMLLYVGLQTAMLMASIIMSTQIQKTLTVPDRNAQLSAVMFLTPVAEICSFLEDTMVVRVNYAVSSGNLPLLRKLMKTGIISCAS
jgi:hypothetical protein